MAEQKGKMMKGRGRINSSCQGRILVGFIVLVIGLLFLLGNVIPGFNFWRFISKFWPIILILVGFYLILGHRKFRRVEEGFSASSHSKLIGDVKLDFAGREIGEINSSILIGDLNLDLTRAILKPGENYVNASLLIGDVVILAPANYKIKILAKALIGDLKYDKIRDDGLFCRIEHEDESYGSAEKRLFINANGLIGDLTIQRIAG